MNHKLPISLHTYAVGAERPATRSALAALMQLVRGSSPLDLSFEDLTGFTYQHAGLNLPDELRYHTGPLCRWAKAHVRRPRGLVTCALNKMFANRRVQQLRQPIVGVCHMGLTDLCRPLFYREQLLGVFYYGAFVALEDHPRVQQHLRQLCRRQALDPDQALAALAEVPRLSRRDLARHEDQLGELVRLTVVLLDGFALPADAFHPRQRARDARLGDGAVPQLVLEAIRVMNHHLDQVLDLRRIADRLNCHPDHLSRVFRGALDTTVGAYLKRLRVERACKLLRLNQLDATRIAYEVGFTDKSNFGRAFRELMGMTPGQYRQRHTAKPTARLGD